MTITKNSITIEKELVPANYIMVDGLGIGDVGEIVLRDRQSLAKDGMFVVIAVVDRQTGKVKGSPDIISRGFSQSYSSNLSFRFFGSDEEE